MIHSTAIVSAQAQIGENVSIGPYTIVHDRVIIGDGSTIESHCEIGHPTALAEGAPLIIGKNSLIRSHSVFYEGSTFGDRLVTGHQATVREKIVAGENLQIGTLSELQGDCSFGDYVRMQSGVGIGKRTQVGSFVWILPYAVLTNDPHPPSDCEIGVTVEDYAVIAAMAVILPGVRIGRHSLVGANSLVRRDVLAHEVVAGSPAVKICDTRAIPLRDGMGGSAYPWPRHFHRGYPDAVIERWKQEYSDHRFESGVATEPR